jgi:hypothetical protein
MEMTIQRLISLLRGVSAGVVPTSIHGELFELVVASWDEFSGSGDTSMASDKILRDAGPEEVTWSPPYFSFVIDRHGGTVLGSTRADRQRWTLNLETQTADQMRIGHRQLRPNAQKLDVKLLADEVCTVVREGPGSASRLVSSGVVVWKNAAELTVFHGKIVGGEYERTVRGRRKRFRADLKTKMGVIGWEFVSAGRGLTFRKTI